VIVCVPSVPAFGVYVTEQLPEEIVQVMAGVNAPDPLEANVIVPVGVASGTELVSVTVAVQVVPTWTASGLGVQTTAVEVERLLTVSEVAPELTEWSASPP
jgi:hypothetical protein